MTFTDEIVAAVGSVLMDDSQERELCNALVGILCVSLSRLPPQGREEFLQAVEDGALRQAIERIPRPANRWKN